MSIFSHLIILRDEYDNFIRIDLSIEYEAGNNNNLSRVKNDPSIMIVQYCLSTSK